MFIVEINTAIEIYTLRDFLSLIVEFANSYIKDKEINMAQYDNSRFTYAQVLNNQGFYMKDDWLRYSVGVETMQTKLNKAGFWCGTPDGKFGGNTDEAVRHFQRAYNLDVDGKAGRNTLTILDSVSAASPGFTKTAGNYGVFFDSTNKKFMYNQQMVFTALKAAGLNNLAIAGFMGNLQAEHEFKTSMNGDSGSVGLAQWLGDRKTNLQNYAIANSMEITNVILQAWFIIEECTSGSSYCDSSAITCMNYLKDGHTITSVAKAADYVVALYERCANYANWSSVQNSGYSTSRFSTQANALNNRYYLDTPKRRGYAEAYYQCICTM